MIKHFLLSIILLSVSICTFSQDFNTYFADKTLRLDYTFTGNSSSTTISLNELSQLPKWAGRRHNLSQLLLDGNGQILVTDLKTKNIIYKESFSTLFQEWQTTEEASNLTKSFENTFLIPYPKAKVKIEVSIRDKKGNYNTLFSHNVDPDDILIRKKGNNNNLHITNLHQGGNVENSINVVILAEGYKATEMPLFLEHANIACQQILNHKPFNKLRNKFNFIAVETISENSGVSVPRNDDWKKTAFGSHFDTFYSERYLTTTNVRDIHDAIAGVPYAHIIILANTNVYGGGGIFNSYTLTTTGHPEFKPVIVHEFGHSFAGLADEYFYENDALNQTYTPDIEPWEPNITSLKNFDTKWKKLLKKGTPIPTDEKLAPQYPIGVFEGAGYLFKGMYRSALDCRMKTNTCKDFCPACQNAIEQLVKFYTE